MDFKKFISKVHPDPDSLLRENFEQMCLLAEQYKDYDTLQLQQTGVMQSVCEIKKEFEGCPLFKQYDNGCYGCKYRDKTVA